MPFKVGDMTEGYCRWVTCQKVTVVPFKVGDMTEGYCSAVQGG